MSTFTAPALDRRSLLKWSGAIAGSAALVGTAANVGMPANADGRQDADKTVWSACVVNCGSRCPLRLQVKDGVVVRVLPDNTGNNELMTRQIRACVRGRSMRQRIYNADRLKKPMKRRDGTKRGDGKWDEISWDEALNLFTDKLDHTIKTYGNEAVFKLYGSGVWNAHFATSGGWGRMLNLAGGHLNYYSNYSYGQIGTCTKFFYGVGDEQISNSFEDTAKNSRLLILWGNNPQETRMSGGGLVYTSQFVKKNNVKVIVIDPRASDSVTVLADQWIPIKPGTDTALAAALAWVLIKENLHDKAFLDKYCQGFDEAHMPQGAPKNASYEAYIMGRGEDKVEKTPQWASKITGVPASTIIQLARDIAAAKPCAITQGWGPQRHMNGENQARAIYTIAAMTGNVGIPGGGTGGREGYFWPQSMWFPDGDNPVKDTISFFGWTEAIKRGPEMTALTDGVRGTDKLKVGIKFLLEYGGNMLSSQHADINATRKLLQDESLCEFIVVVDNQMSPSAHMADLILPDTTTAERWDQAPSEYTGDMAYLIECDQAIAPLHDSIPAYKMVLEITKRLEKKDPQRYKDITKKFLTTPDGTVIPDPGDMRDLSDMKAWVEWMQGANKAAFPHFPTFAEMQKVGVYRYTNPDGLTVPLKPFRDDPVKNKLDTPSGKIEIYSTELAEMARTWTFTDPQPGDKITPLPEYMTYWEDAEEAKTNKDYPLQSISHHFKGRTHSTYANMPWLMEGLPQTAWINTSDAADRGIENGDQIDVWNDRGHIRIQAYVTPRIMPGVISVPQGAWCNIDADGVDLGGAANSLTRIHFTAYAKGNPQHTALVQVKKS